MFVWTGSAADTDKHGLRRMCADRVTLLLPAGALSGELKPSLSLWKPLWGLLHKPLLRTEKPRRGFHNLILNGSPSYKIFERQFVWSNEQRSSAVLHE